MEEVFRLQGSSNYSCLREQHQIEAVPGSEPSRLLGRMLWNKQDSCCSNNPQIIITLPLHLKLPITNKF